jgi:hypothetical protein
VVPKDRLSGSTYIWSIYLSVSRASGSYNIPAAPVYVVYISDSSASGSYNIPAAPVYGVYISDSRASGSYKIPAAPTYGVYISQFLRLVVPMTFQQHMYMEYISLSF